MKEIMQSIAGPEAGGQNINDAVLAVGGLAIETPWGAEAAEPAPSSKPSTRSGPWTDN